MKNDNFSILALANEVSKISGVQLGEKQTNFVVQRFRRRMLELGLTSEVEYIEYYIRHRDTEFKELLSLLTTHHTYFFREYKHFEMLEDHILPALIPEVRKRADKTLHFWSAACSRGQEVFSLAIFIDLYLKKEAPDLKFHIWGTDVDVISVEFAKNAVFSKKEVDGIPQVYQSDHFIRGRGELSQYVKIHPEILKCCSFKDANLLEAMTWPKQQFDIIFCRNVFIYFSKEDIQKTAVDMTKVLSKEGFLFLGLTETFNGMEVQLKSHGPSVYKHKSKAPVVEVKVPPLPVTAVPKFKRVLCVDDSPTVLSLLKQVFTSDTGYVVADTASNGKEALFKMRMQQFDLVTLDIHMPVLSGIDLLKQTSGINLPPILVISSVDRQEQSIAVEMLRLGANDYVEKPRLKDFANSREEILFKAETITKNPVKRNFASTVDHLFQDRIPAGKFTAKVGVLYKSQDSAIADECISSVSTDSVRYRKILLPDTDAPIRKLFEANITCCDALVVMSSLNAKDLEMLKRYDIECFLLEEAFSSSPEALNSFEIFPMASLGYAVGRYLRNRNESA